MKDLRKFNTIFGWVLLLFGLYGMLGFDTLGPRLVGLMSTIEGAALIVSANFGR